MTDRRDPADTGAQPDEDREPEGGRPQERPEDRPNVGSTTPEDYPSDERATGQR